jgi:peroxiredoxin
MSSNRKNFLVMGGFFLLGVALALLLFGQPLLDKFNAETAVDLPQISSADGGVRSANPDINSIVAGDKAPRFALLDVNGTSVSLSDFNGRPLMINFWATWCPPCRLEMPELQKAHTGYQDQGLVVLAVNQQEETQQVREFMNELGLTFTPLLDTDGNVGRAYGAQALPSTYFVDRSGQVTAVHRGILSEEQIEAYLTQILP